MTAPLTMSHHAPVGAWTSLVLGEPNRGVCIALEALTFDPNADLLIALTREGGPVQALPFVQDPSAYPNWQFLPASDLSRKLTPCIDEFSAASAGLTLRLFTPHAALPNPKRSGNLQYATAPGVLLEVDIDNSNSDLPATAFIGLRSISAGRLRPIDWSSKTLTGIAHGSKWVFVAPAAKGEHTTLQSNRLPHALTTGEAEIDPTATTGGILIKVAPRTRKTVPVVFAAYQGGNVTQGIDARYLYAAYFPRVEAVANFLLQNAQRLRESCTSLDTRATAACPDDKKLAHFSQGIRAYEASTQVLDGGAGPTGGATAYFAAISPADGRRNPMERTVDHLPWELYRNPWVIRNLFDLATATYAYHEKVRFEGDAEESRAGGMTFARDFGYAGAYAPGAGGAGGPAGVSAFDGAGTGPGWSGGAMATESLLNAVYMLTSYALMADDTPWAKTRLPFARELLTSMEARDHWDPEQRNGILKATSISAPNGETTAFAGLDPVLSAARGNLYLAVKTFCANLMLTTYFQNNNDLHSADYSYAFAQKTAKSLAAAFNADTQSLPANLLSPQDTSAKLLAALEPLAVPTYLGLTSTLAEYFPELYAALKSHALTCLKPTPEGCINPDGSLRLASTTNDTLPAKTINVLFVLERLFQIDTSTQLPNAWNTLTPTTTEGLLTTALYLRVPAAPTP